MLKREEKEGAKPNNISTTKTLLQSHLKTPWVFRPTLSCKLSLKDSYLLFSLLPLPSKGYPTHQGILHKMRVEKAAGVKAPPIQTRLWPEEALRTPCVPYHCRVNSGCLFPLCFPLGKEVRDWAVQVISKSAAVCRLLLSGQAMQRDEKGPLFLRTLLPPFFNGSYH